MLLGMLALGSRRSGFGSELLDPGSQAGEVLIVVVGAGLAALDRNHAVVVPGWMNKVVAASTRFAPRPVVRKIAGAIKY